MKNVRLKLTIALAIISIASFCFALSGTALPVRAEDGQTQVSSESITMNMYKPNTDSGYTLTNKVETNAFGSTAYTSLSLIVEDGDIVTSTFKGHNAFGVTGTSVNLNFKINHSGGVNETISGEWLLCGDSWGDDSGENVNGVQTGQVGSGALVIQTSTDGVNWSNENKGKYTDGLYTTDYYTHYQTAEQTIIFIGDYN